MSEPYQNENAFCTKPKVSAERELSAFFNAVAELLGPEQAALAAKDWLQQLDSIPDLPTSPREWRLLSIQASARLVKRVNPYGSTAANAT